MVTLHLLITALLLLIAIGFQFSGAFPLLNTVDYSTIKDAKKFNRYVGYRVLLPAVVSGISALVTSIRPHLGMALVFVSILSILAFVVWVSIGSKAFTIK